MSPRWITLNEAEQSAYRATIAFLRTRLAERATIDWALQLKQNETVKRLALLTLVDSPDGQKTPEPWKSAWRLIEESWNGPAIEGGSSANPYQFQRRLKAGDRSGALVSAIAEHVTPRLKVEPFSDLHLSFQKPPPRPRKADDLFLMSLTSGKLIDPAMLELGNLTDLSFLLPLANALDAAVTNGLDIARRIGWVGEGRLWRLGELRRVYYVESADRREGVHEPDEFHRGIAPSVKLLHAVVARLADVDISAANLFVRRWKTTSTIVHIRLWAALSRDPRITLASEVGPLLLSLDDRRFWNVMDFPEIAELRAMRFTELDPHQRAEVTTRIRKRPPRNQWPRMMDGRRVAVTRVYWAVRELRRIEVAGATLHARDRAWMNSNIQQFPELVQMSRADEGFLETPQARFVPPNPDSQYDLLAGELRLKQLESSLSLPRRAWDDNPAERAADWMRQGRNSLLLIADFESVVDAGATFTQVWERFGWTHSPAVNAHGDHAQRNLTNEAARVLALIAKLPLATIKGAVEGISNWLSTWQEQVVHLPDDIAVWQKVWPIAVEATNARPPVEDEADINTVSPPLGDREPMDLDTLNTPAGKLVGVFLQRCPNLGVVTRPFDTNGPLRFMRDTVVAAPGRSGLIARHRMIEWISYFQRADPSWTQAQLITPLLPGTSASLALWRAFARRPPSKEVLNIVGSSMADHAIDPRLARDTRRPLVIWLIFECLHALHEAREPAISHARIQQMIRSLDDEVRADGAEAIWRFVRDLSTPSNGVPNPPTADHIFRSAAAPFLRQVWPQERSLTTPGVSEALAKLPAAIRGAFGEAVDAVERFLVPFQCWSLMYYGLDGEENGEKKLSKIITARNSAALLRLLDRTIGAAENSVAPYDLSDALDHVRAIAPNLVETQTFRRLGTVARRA